jgi:predicted GIY-YIG superfamily endonuclease
MTQKLPRVKADRLPAARQPPDYSLGKIYRIINPNNTKYYIGSTILPLEKRFEQHKRAKVSYDKKNKTAPEGLKGRSPARKLASFELLEGGSIELIKNYPCKTRTQLQKEEGELIRNHKESITNFFVAGVSLHDWFKAYGIMKKINKNFK